jgi:hypothetical protein
MPSLLSHLQRDSQDFYGRTFEDNYEMPPNERLEAACRAAGAGDIEAVREWLATTDDVNALNVAEPAFGVAGSSSASWGTTGLSGTSYHSGVAGARACTKFFFPPQVPRYL